MTSISSKTQYSKFHLEDKCRICLTKSLNDMTDLNASLNKDSSGLLVCEALETVMGEEIPSGDEFPTRICGICLSLLSISYDLKVEYFKSKTKLLQLAHASHSDEENTTETIFLKEELDEDVDYEILQSDMNFENDEGCSDDETNVTAIENRKQENSPSVELVVGESSYDINNVLVVEESSSNDNTRKTYNNFLENLGPTISASIAGKTANKINGIEDEDILLSRVIEKPAKETPRLKTSNSCCHCKRTFNTAAYLTKHVAVCEKFKNLECYVCFKKFKNRRSLVSHITHIHLTGKDVTIGGVNMKDIDLHCHVCNKLCTNKKNLWYHMSTHKEKEYSCEVCGKSFSQKSVFKKHQQVHQRETKVVCPVCGKSFHYDSGLFYHMKVHTNERKYQCSFCSKTFYNMCGLKRHERTHTGERPYLCQYCNKGFRSSGEKKNHEFLHTGERPYTCEICSIGFTKAYNRNIHLMTHEGDHKCSICRKGFINHQILIYHLKIKHGLKEVNADNIDIEKESDFDEEEVIIEPTIEEEEEEEEDTTEQEVEYKDENVDEENPEYDIEEYGMELDDL